MSQDYRATMRRQFTLVAFSIVIYKSSASTNADSAYITGYFVQSYIE